MRTDAELHQFWNGILFSLQSDTTLQLLGEALSYAFFSSNIPDYAAHSPHDNPYSMLRIGLHDKLLNLTQSFYTHMVLRCFLFIDWITRL